MTFIIAYVAILLVFGICDALWLGTMGPALYRPTLGNLLLERIRIVPAVLFYLSFPAGIVVFAVLPALKDGNLMTAAFLGLLFGAIAYATYDLTNYATLKAWTLQLTVVDIVYGALVTALSAAAGYQAARWWGG